MNNKNPLQVLETADGSFTLYNPDIGDTYHSLYGAITESRHVYIAYGFKQSPNNPLHILEVGLGTGLNALLTSEEAINDKIRVHYTALEPFPVSEQMITLWSKDFSEESKASLFKIHQSTEQPVQINQYFSYLLYITDLQTFNIGIKYHIVYYDAFAPGFQPELWTEEMFGKITGLLVPGGILVTYCSKGSVKRNLRACGFRVNTLPGPPGKREMIQALLDPV